MHAVQITEFGGPEVLHLEEVPMPERGSGEIVVRVRPAGVNRLDALLRAGQHAVRAVAAHAGYRYRRRSRPGRRRV